MYNKLKILSIACLTIWLSSCLEDNPETKDFIDPNIEENDYNYMPGALNIQMQKSDSMVEIGNYIIFHDSSMTENRTWTFEGGNPAKSNAQTVKVHYYESGKFDYSLAVFKDSTVDSLIHKEGITAFEKGYYLAKRNNPTGNNVNLEYALEYTSAGFKDGLYGAMFFSSEFPDGFNVVEVNNGFKYLGPGDDFNIVPTYEREANETTFDFYRGSLIETDNEFSTNESAIYYVGIDVEMAKVVVVPFHQWGLSGSALGNENSDDIVLDSLAITTKRFSFGLDNVAMMIGDYKIRYNNGDYVVVDKYYDNGEFLETGIRIYMYLGSYNGYCNWGNYFVEQESENEYFNVKLDWNKDGGFKWTANPN